MSYGRSKIYSDAKEITAANVKDEVSKALAVHNKNQSEIEALWRQYRGQTKILEKTKEIRQEINHKINVNVAYEVTKFHKGYVFGEPIQYVRRENTAAKEDDDIIATDINALNGYMSDANKAAVDNALAEWMYVAGTAYRLILANKKWTADGDESPFSIYSLDPRRTFIVYSMDVDEHPLMAVCCAERANNEKVFTIYTDKFVFTYGDYTPMDIHTNTIGMLPIIEYPAEHARLGVFEVAMPLLDALNELQSNRMDDIVQFVNSFLGIFGGSLDEETYAKLGEWKTLCLPEGTDAKYLSASLSQSDVQTLKDDIYQSILTITGVPSTSDGSTSDSSNNGAVILRNGWQSAEARAKATEEIFKSSEKEFLKIALRILRDTVGTKLRLTDIAPHFTRRNYENIASKSQVLIAMLNNPWVHPEVAYASCGMFPDPESAYLQGKSWHEQQEKKAMEKAEAFAKKGGDDDADSGTDQVSKPAVQSQAS